MQQQQEKERYNKLGSHTAKDVDEFKFTSTGGMSLSFKDNHQLVYILKV